MKLLAIETSTIACSVALYDQKQIIEQYIVAPREHATRILTMVEEVLTEGGYTLNQLDALVFARGPGSFTGLRIAASVIQGLAISADLPVIPVSTLAILAQGAYRTMGAEQVLTALDARMQEIYWAGFCLNPDSVLMQPVIAETVVAPERVEQPKLTNWYGIGNGWESYRHVLLQRIPLVEQKINAGFFPHAQDSLVFALNEFKAGRAVSAEHAVPVYLRNKVTN